MDYVGRPLTCKVVPLFGECDCFATLPEQAVEGLRNEMRIRGPGVVVIEIEHGDKVDYVSWGQQVQERTEGGNCVGIPSLMMKELNLEKDTMVGIRYFIKIQQAKEVHVIPATVDDSEVIEHNQTRLEDLILRQLRVAYEGQVVPIFVRQGLHVRIKVTKITAPQVYPTKVPVVTLGDGTELIVETKMRDKPAASDAKNPPQPATLRVVSTTPTDGIPVLRITKETLEKFHWVEGSLMPCVPHTGIAAVAWGGAKTDKKVSASGVRRHTFNIIVKLHENGDLAVNEASVSCNIPTGSLVLVDPSLESSGTHTELAARTTVANVAGDVSVVQTEAWQDLKRALSFQTPSSGVHSVYSDAHAARSLGGLARSTLIVGGSGSGKTTVLEAVKEHASIYTVHFAKEDPDTADDQKQEKAAETDKVLKRLEKSFLEAAVNAPSLLLIDDLDQLVGEAPEQGRDLNLEMLADTVCELMLKHDQSPAVSHMAGVLPRAASSGVTVIATATNTDKVNPKISPMFSFSVKLPLPNGSEREAIARKTLQTEGFKPHKGVLSHLARETNNYTPRDVAGLSSKAAHQARISSTEKTVLWEHYEAAMSDFTPASLSGINMYKPSDLSWADVGGLDDIKKIFNETVILPTKYPELYANLPIKMRSGVLLYGPTGCGKSHVISCAVAEAGLNCIQVSGPELLNKYIGQSEQRVREVFEQAQAAAPCILFFDEFDSIAPQRGHDNTGVTDRVVNQLLCHLDGAEGRSGVYVVAATARPDLIDKALLRPGRLDVSAYCGMPGLAEREAVLCAAGRKLKIADGVSMATLAEQTQGYTSADLAAVLSTARLQCIQEIVDTSAALANMNVDDIVTKEAKESANEAWVSLHAAPADRDGLDSYISDLGLTSATATTLLPEAKLPIITGPILSSALGTTKASISKQDVERNTNLYKKFQASRSSSTRDEKPKGQRTTMAKGGGGEMPFLKEAEGSSGGWGDRMVLINQLHKEHAISDGNVEELCFDDPDQVMKYKRKQAVLSFQGAKKDGRDKFDQVFKALELKEVSKVLLPMNGKEEKKDHTETAEKPPLKPTKHQYNTRKQTKMAKDTSKPIEIIIPLAHDRVKSSAVHTDKALQVEYAARYLEKLGVSPSPVNLQLITKHVPLSACKIQQIFHPGLSNHDKKNYIVIRPNQKHAKVNISSLYDPTTIPFEELPKDLLDKDDTSKDGKTGKDKKESQLRSFEEYRESYLFPYNLRGRHSTACMKDIPHNTMLPATGSINSNTIENRALSSTVLSTTVPGKPYAHPVVADDQRVAITEQQLKLQDSLVGLIKRRAELSEDELNKLREEVELKAAEGELSALEYHPDLDNDSPARDLQTKNTPVKDISTPVMTKERERGLDKELANPPSASTGHIRNLLQSFVEDFPFKTHWGNEGMKERLMHNLEGPVVVSFVQKFISFLYWSFLAPHVEAVAMKREAQNYDENFVEVYQDMLEITVLKRNKQHFSVDLPVTILALRVVTETIFKIAYPLWSTLSRGEQLLYEVNLLITQLLDPMNYFSHISAIESSPQALKTLHKKKVPPRMGLSFTSPMTRFIIGDARSREAKALLSSTRKTAQRESAIFSQLTPTVRARLLSILSGYRLEHGPGGPGGSKKHRQKPPLSPMTPPPTSASRSTRPMLKE